MQLGNHTLFERMLICSCPCLCSAFVVLVRGSQVEKVLEFQVMVVVVLLEKHPASDYYL